MNSKCLNFGFSGFGFGLFPVAIQSFFFIIWSMTIPKKKPQKNLFQIKKTVLLFLTSLAHCCKFVLLPKLCRRVMVHPVISFTTISGKISLCEKSWNYKFISLWNHIITIIFLLFAFWMSCLMITIKFNNIELIISHWL